MEQIYTPSIKKIKSNQKQIELAFKVKLNFREGIVFIDGKPDNEISTIEFIEAINLGFSITKALDLKYEDFEFRKIKIKSIATRKNLSQVRARIIGKHRKVMDNLEYLTGCDIVLHDNIVGIIGQRDAIHIAEQALKNLIAGSKHASVYAFLEKMQKQDNE